MDILVTIFAYIFGAFLVLGVLGLWIMFIRIIIDILRGKTSSGMPWWVFWSALHHDD